MKSLIFNWLEIWKNLLGKECTIIFSTSASLFFCDFEFGLELDPLLFGISTKLIDHFAGKVIKNGRQPVAIFSRPKAIINLIFLSKLLSFLIERASQVTLIPYQVNTLFRNVLLNCLLYIVVTFL